MKQMSPTQRRLGKEDPHGELIAPTPTDGQIPAGPRAKPSVT
jgi:hypothetical protein